MGLFGGEQVQVLHAGEAYTIVVGKLSVEEYASDVITKKKNGKRDKAWELAHPLMKRCYGIPGIKDGKKALLICSRDVVWDAQNQHPELYSKEKIEKRMGEMAYEQQHKADASGGSAMNKTVVLLGAAALIMVIGVVFMVLTGG